MAGARIATPASKVKGRTTLMSKIVRFHAAGGPEVLTLDEVEVREPGQGEIRIRTRALAVNRADAVLRSSHVVGLPSGIGWEASGEVDAIGPGVEGFTVGDAVSMFPASAPRISPCTASWPSRPPPRW